MSVVTALIIRKRFVSPLVTPKGIKRLVFVTYATHQLAPEVLQFDQKTYTKKLEYTKIKARVETRLGLKPLPNEEFILEGQ